MRNSNKKECNEIILSLDAASRKTGYAIFRNGKIEVSGTWKLKKETRFVDLYNNINAAIKEYRISYIVAENIFDSKDIRKKEAFPVLAECRGIIELITQINKIPLSSIMPIAVKRYIWGMQYGCKYSSKQQKEIMIRTIQKLGYELENDKADDEADAIGLMIAYLGSNGYDLQHPKDELRIIKVLP